MRLPRCIAYVPARREIVDLGNGQRYARVVDAHRCEYLAHALPAKGVQVCLVHAGTRARKTPARNPDQIALDLGGKE